MKIDPEFKSHIPPLSHDELEQLEQSLLTEGCREKLIVWQGILIDGHNRHSICEKHSLPYKTCTIELPSREAALDWIVSNQLGRRNLTPEQASYLRGKQYNRLKTAGHGKKSARQNVGQNTAERLAETHKVTARTIERDAQYAKALDKIDPELKRQVLSRESELTKSQVIDLANNRPLVTTNTGFEEWYTPQPYLDAARKVLGTIDLDPASSAYANQTVKATVFYAKEDDGLSKQWQGKVWLNPPYSAGLIDKFIYKLLESFPHDVPEAIVLVNNCTDTKWFQAIAKDSILCLTNHRVRFINPSKVSSPTQGQAILYLGDNKQSFRKEFGQFGLVLRPYANT